VLQLSERLSIAAFDLEGARPGDQRRGVRVASSSGG
jgi:hypothetical protein